MLNSEQTLHRKDTDSGKGLCTCDPLNMTTISNTDRSRTKDPHGPVRDTIPALRQFLKVYIVLLYKSGKLVHCVSLEALWLEV